MIIPVAQTGWFAFVVALYAGLVSGAGAQTSDKISEQEAHAIGLSAYLYFYPLVTMDLTRKQLTNVVKAEGLGAPMNAFANVPTYPAADMKAVVRPNFDTLYSSAWLDLTKGPVVVSVPDTHGRYYLLPMLDMWTDVFASPGWRTTGTAAGNFAVVPPGWTGTLPVDVTTPPKEQVDTMPADKFFAYAAELLKQQAPHITDQPILAQMKRIGLERGKSFDINKANAAVKTGLETAPEDAQKLMAWKVPTLARVVNDWSMNTDTMGVYGNYYLKRAIVTQLGLGANLPDDAIYPINLGDQDGKPLDGASAYTLHFDKAATPPAGAFWSITLYDKLGYQVANPLNRFAVSSWMPFKYNSDGSLDLYFQNTSPGPNKEANWLPAPKGPFTLTMRLYAPESDALTGKWNPPPITRNSEASPLTAQ